MTKPDRWRRDPVGFIETVLHDPETGKPFKLLDAELQFLDQAFRTGADGRLLYPEQVFAAPKKSGKTGFAAIHNVGYRGGGDVSLLQVPTIKI